MSKDNDNLRLIRQHMISRIFPQIQYQLSQLGAIEELGRLRGDDSGKKFMRKITDFMMSELGHPVTTSSSFDKVWKYVHGA